MFKTGLMLMSVIMLVFLIACGMPGDPMLDDMYTRNVYPGVNNTYSIGSPALLYSDGYFTNLASGNIMLGGVPLLIPACGEMYITVPVATPMAIAGTYYKALGTTVAGELRGFTDGLGRLTYNDITPNRICLVCGAMSMSSDTVNNVISAQLYINDLPEASSIISIKLLQVGDIDTMTLIALVTLDPGDYIEVWIASDKAGVNVTLQGLNFTATTVD